MTHKSIFSLLKYSLVLSIILLTGCAKESRTVETDEQIIETSRNLYSDLTDKYRRELRYLRSGDKRRHVKHDIVRCARSKEYRQSFWDRLATRDYEEPGKIPLHFHIKELKKDLRKLSKREHKLCCIAYQDEAQILYQNVRILKDELFDIKSVVMSSSEFSDEKRYLSQAELISKLESHLKKLTD